jgi:hypothetical protein
LRRCVAWTRRETVYRDAAADDNVKDSLRSGILMPSLSGPLRVISGALVLALVQALPCAGQAETRVEGPADALTVEARAASIQEVLAALGAAYGVQIHGSTGLDAVIDGTYEGSLQRVIGRLLAGFNYVAKSSAGNLDVTILSAPNGAASPGGMKQRAPFVREVASSPNPLAVRGGTSIANRRNTAETSPAATGSVPR